MFGMFNEILLKRLYGLLLLFFFQLIWQVWCFLKVKLRRQRHLEESQSTPKQECIFLNMLSFRIFQILRTLPLSRSSWHLLRQSGLLVNSTKAFSAWSRVVVSVVSYSCLHRFSNWARLWKRSSRKKSVQPTI